MRKARIAQVIILVVIGYLLFQIILYVLYIHKESDSLPQTDEPRSRNFTSTSYVNIQELVSASLAHGVPLVLLDPAVLQHVTEDRVLTWGCNYLCNLGNTTVFGVLYQLWNHHSGLLRDLSGRGFTMQYAVAADLDTVNYLSQPAGTVVYTHYLLRRRDHILHIVIMYELASGYLWHGRLEPHDLRGDTVIALPLTRPFTNESIYNKMEVTKVTLDGLKLRAPKYPVPFLKQINSSTFLRCNQTRARLFNSKYGSPEDNEKISFRNAAKHILRQAKEVLDYLQIPFWLSSGTCLGWHRQCDTIAYSGDVDLGIFIKHYDRRLIPAMEEAGIRLKYLFGRESDSFELTFNNGEMKLDLFFFYEEAAYIWNGGTQLRSGEKYKYIFPKIDMCWTEFLDFMLRVPCDPNAYLSANYGPNWFEPVKQWDWKSSPPNVHNNGKWPEHDLEEVIQIFGKT